MKIKPGYKIRTIAGENVIVSVGTLNVNMTKVISLNDTSVWLWNQLGNNDFDNQTVADLLCQHFDVDHDTALADSNDWINSLRNANLIEE